MIEIVLGVLLSISTHTACDLGKPVDYYAWVNAHPDYSAPMTISVPDDTDYWLMSDGVEYYLFKFKQPIAQTIGSGEDHGSCFRDVGKVG